MRSRALGVGFACVVLMAILIVMMPCGAFAADNTISQGITGRVYSEASGAPVDATLEVYRRLDGDDNLWDWCDSVVTDSDGRYSVELPAGTYQVVCLVNERTQVSLRATVTEGQIVDLPFALELSSIEGRVKARATGEPISGISVRAYDVDVNTWAGSAYSDASGYYAIEVPPGNYFIGFFDASGYAYASQWWDATDDGSLLWPGSGSERVDVGEPALGINASMREAAHVSGRLTDAATGRSVRGFVNGFADVGGSWEWLGYTSTDASGYYSMRDSSFGAGLPAGSYKLQSDVDERWVNQWYDGASSFEDAEVVTLGDGESRDGCDFALKRYSMISGRVTDEDGQPAPASVVAYKRDPSGWTRENVTETDASGYYSFGFHHEGAFRVAFFDLSGYGFAAQAYPGADSIDAGQDVNVLAGDSINGIDAIMHAGGRITGRVQSPEGAVRARVTAYSAGFPDASGYASAYTSAEGYYTLSGFTNDSVKLLFEPKDVKQPGLPSEYWDDAADVDGATPITTARGTDFRADAFLGNAARVSGTVTLPRVADVYLSLLRVNPDDPTNELFLNRYLGEALSDVSGYSSPRFSYTYTGNTLTYSMGELPKGTYVMAFQSLGAGGEWYDNVPIDGNQLAKRFVISSESQVVEGIDANLEEAAVIFGSFTAPAGVPAHDLRAELYYEDATSGWQYIQSMPVDPTGEFIFGNLIPGSYKVRVYDELGRMTPTFFNGSFSLESAEPIVLTAGELRSVAFASATDSLAPVTGISSIPAGWSTGDVSFTLSPSDSGSGVDSTYYKIGALAQQTYAGSAVTVSTEGATSVSYWSVDKAGNVETARTATVKIDKTAPLTRANVSSTYESSARIVLAPQDAVSGVSATSYRIDGGSWTDGTIALVSTLGSHTLEYRSTDTAGNVEATKTARFSVVAPDTAAPVTTISGVPSAWSSVDVTLTLSAVDTGRGVFATYYKVAGGAPTDYTKPFVVSTEGTTSVSYWSVDRASNTETAKTATVKIDKTAPLSSSDATSTYETTATIKLSATDAMSGVSATNYKLDNGAWAAGASVSTSALGSHTLSYRSTDAAGNVEATKTVSFTVRAPDTASPMTTISGVPASWANSAVVMTLTATDAGSGVDRSYFRIGTGAPAVYIDGITVDTEGTTQVGYWSVDKAGNAEATKTATVKIDKTPPSVTATVAASAGGSAVSIEATDTLSGVSKVFSRCTKKGEAPSAFSQSASVTVDKPGAWEVEYYATDNAGNQSASQTIAVQVKGNGVMTVKPPKSAPKGGAAFQLTVSVVAPDGAPAAGEQVSLYAGAKLVGTKSLDASGNAVFDCPGITTAQTYRAMLAGSQVVEAAELSTVVKPLAAIGRPVAASRVKRGASTLIKGTLRPQHRVGSRPVKLVFMRWERSGGTWKYVAKFSKYPTVSSRYSYSQYGFNVKLPTAGKWAIRAYHASDADAATSASDYEYLRVY